MLKKIIQTLRKKFFAGLLITLPVVITIYFSVIFFNAIDKICGPLVTELLIQFGIPIKHTFRIPGFGIIVSLVFIFMVGLLVTNFIGKKVVSTGEKILDKIPIISSIYYAAKQIIQTFGNASSNSFRTVVMLEFPIEGMFTIGIISSSAEGEPQALLGQEFLNVFVPTVPNITTGFYLLVPREKLTPLTMSAEEAIKMMISGGILMPEYNPRKDIKNNNNSV